MFVFALLFLIINVNQKPCKMTESYVFCKNHLMFQGDPGHRKTPSLRFVLFTKGMAVFQMFGEAVNIKSLYSTLEEGRVVCLR